MWFQQTREHAQTNKPAFLIKVSRMHVTVLKKCTGTCLWDTDAQGWDSFSLKHQRDITEREGETYTLSPYPTEMLNSITPHSTWEYLLGVQHCKNQKTWQWCPVCTSACLYLQRRDFKCLLITGREGKVLINYRVSVYVWTMRGIIAMLHENMHELWGCYCCDR